MTLYPERRAFAGMVAAMDEAIGTIIDSAVTKGIWSNTLTLFTTDNGGPVGTQNPRAPAVWD